MILDNDFVAATYPKRFYDFNGELLIENMDLDWDWFIDLLDAYPKKNRKIHTHRLGWELRRLNEHIQLPKWAWQIEKDLHQIFPGKSVTLHSFGGLTDDSKSPFNIHKDGMDVFYVQVLGEIEWSIHTPKEGATETPSIDGGAELKIGHTNTIYSDWFIPGRAIYIPAGTYHNVKPYSSRVGFSFGIEDIKEE